MNKLFSTLLLALSVCLTACADEKVITAEQLPATAQTFVKTYFADDAITLVMQDRDGLSLEYEVRLNSGSKIEFDGKGEIKKVDCQAREVPEGIVPEAVKKYVATTFPNTMITEWGKDGRKWKAELNNGIDLEFNSKYEFVRIDD